MLIQPTALRDLVCQAFVTAGTDHAIALETANHLVQANLKGHDSHGVGMVPIYMANLKNGHLQPNAHMSVISDRGSVVHIDGQFGFGQVVGREATDLAIERARSNGLVCVGIKNAHHLGRIGTYGERCGEAGLISIHLVNVVGHNPTVSPWGSGEPRLQTNPFCCVVPRDGDTPIVLDMATSAIALGKVRVAYMAGKTVSAGALVDHEGRPTDDPRTIYEEPRGSLGPFGQHKGYGLALMCELLGGGLVGEWTMQPAHGRRGTVVNNMLMFVLDPDVFGGHDAFQQEILAMVDYVRSATPGADVDRVRIPGEPELESKAVREADGIPIDDNTWNGILAAAKSAGMSNEEIARYSSLAASAVFPGLSEEAVTAQAVAASNRSAVRNCHPAAERFAGSPVRLTA